MDDDGLPSVRAGMTTVCCQDRDGDGLLSVRTGMMTVCCLSGQG